MNEPATPPPSRPFWTAARLLKVMLAAQCLVAVMVVVSDLPHDVLRGFQGGDAVPPTTAVPVTPGNQTRQFEPSRLRPSQGPTGPGFVSDTVVPSRLEFSPSLPDNPDSPILLSGMIVRGDADRFDAWLQALATPPRAFALHSPGGAVDEALRIGRTIRATGASVMVAAGASCFSACPYILAGGAERDVSRQALVGVHQHYFGENTYLPAFLLVSDIQVGQGEVMAYLSEMGVDPMVMAKAMMTPPDDIYILLPAELETYKLSTHLSE